MQLHGFSDASGKASACVIYLRILFNNGDIFMAYVASKSQVAPRVAFQYFRHKIFLVFLSLIASLSVNIFFIFAGICSFTAISKTLIYFVYASFIPEFKREFQSVSEKNLLTSYNFLCSNYSRRLNSGKQLYCILNQIPSILGHIFHVHFPNLYISE